MKTSLFGRRAAALTALVTVSLLVSCSGDSVAPSGPAAAVSRSARPAHLQAYLAPGGRITGTDVEPLAAEFVGGDGVYSSDIYLFEPTTVYIATSHVTPAGTVVSLGTTNPNEEWVFGIYVRNTGYTYYSGDPSRNPDGRPHATLYSESGPCIGIGFEETFGGGDEDYNDVVLKLCREETNHAPVADAGPRRVVECSDMNRTPVTLDGSASTDPDGDPLTYTWKDWSGNVIGSGPTLAVTCPGLGAHGFYLVVDDGRGGSSTAIADIWVDDTTAPVISQLCPSVDVLDPPNHKMTLVAITAVAIDACRPGYTSCRITSVTANEPVEPGDIEIYGLMGVNLRATRSGSGNGRVYTITVTCDDAAGNSVSKTTTVTVPKGKK